jgi:hypothetical protein
MQQGSLWNWLGGITTIVLAGVVLSNGKNVANILNGIGGLYGAAAGAARSGSSSAQH